MRAAQALITPAVTRRRVVASLATAALGLGLPWRTGAIDPAFDGARLYADFEPVGAMWLVYDAGHEAFTAELARALWKHVPIRMLVRDAEAEDRARALLTAHGLDAAPVAFVQDIRAPYFVRDAAVFGLDGRKRPFIVDFEWTHYGWARWCRRTHAGDALRAQACARIDDTDTGKVDRRLAAALGLPVFASPLAMEGGGVEVNGQGLLIANTQLWSQRNPGQTREKIEARLKQLPGVRKVIWLPSGLAQDTLHRASITGRYVGWGTGGHNDEFVRFADARTVLLAWPDAADVRTDPVARLNLARMRINHAVLTRSTDARGAPLRVIKVPLPRTIARPVVLSELADTSHSEQWTAASFPAREGRRNGDTVLQVATSSYLNHVLTDRLVLLPDYLPHGTPAERQDEVHAIYQAAFPGRKVKFINAIQANWFGGGAHCATLSQPPAHS